MFMHIFYDRELYYLWVIPVGIYTKSPGSSLAVSFMIILKESITWLYFDSGYLMIQLRYVR